MLKVKTCASEQNIKLALMFYCERSQVSITRSVVKACENIKLALMFYCERSQVSITRSVVKGKNLFLFSPLSFFYQIFKRSSSGTNIGHSSVMPNAVYQSSMWGSVPFTLQRESECTSLFVRLRISSSRTWPAQTPE